MQLTLRPYVTAGIALAGASVIAVSPISPVTPSLPDIQVHASSAAVDLASAVNPIGDPISAWVTTLTNAVENLGALGGQVIDNGAPILTQILANQMGYANLVGAGFEGFRTGFEGYLNTTLPFYLQYASDFLEAGQIGEAFSWAVVYPLIGAVTTMFPLINNLKIPGMMAQNVANALQAIPAAIQPIGLGAILTFTNPLNVFGAQLQSISDAVNAGDPLSAVNAALNIPAAMTDSFLTGLLKPYTNFFDTGLIASLVVDLPRTIANAITPPAPPVVAAAVESAPDTLVADTLATDALPTAETPAIEASTTPNALPTITDQTPASARLARELTGSVTGTVGRITSAAASAFDAVKTVTLKVDPKPAATETSTTGESSTDSDTAGSTDTSANEDADNDASGASNTKADKVSKKGAGEDKRQARQQARADRQQARQVAKKEAKSENSSGGKHRAAAKGSDK